MLHKFNACCTICPGSEIGVGFGVDNGVFGMGEMMGGTEMDSMAASTSCSVC